MVNERQNWLSGFLTLLIVFLAGFVVHRFVVCLLWAGVISAATMPLYQKWQAYFKHSETVAALLFTSIVSIGLILPLSWLITDLVQEIHLFINTLTKINHSGAPVPSALSSLPGVGDEISRYWQNNFAKPGGLMHWLASLQLSLAPLTHLVQKIGYNLIQRGIQLGFTLLTLFFFYRDGQKLASQIQRVGENYIGERWSHYASKFPGALRAAVNGSVLVGIGVGLIMGTLYWCLGFAAPVLAGFFTAVAAMIPFAVPIVFVIVAAFLFVEGAWVASLVVLFAGGLVMFVADHLVKPALIGGSTRMPFLMVLFAILGGVETLGILGLFLGPIIMVMFMTLWQELLHSS